MRKADVFVRNIKAGTLLELDEKFKYMFVYEADYSGAPVSLTLKVRTEPYEFTFFPPFFEGLLPEGLQLEALLRTRKIDRNDFFSQLLAVGEDLVGAVQVRKSHD